MGNRAVAFVAPDDRLSWQPHAVDAWYTGPAIKHYRLLEFFNPLTGGMLNTGTYQIFPAHCKIPTISEGDLTIQAATELLRDMKASPPEIAAQKVHHIKYCVILTMF